MRTIKSVLEKNKGLFSFLLVFVVLYTGSFRGLLVANLAQNEISNQKHSPNNHSECDIHTANNAVFNAVNQAKTLESEIDEVHLDYILPISDFFTFVSLERHSFCQFLGTVIVHKLPLYDLFCNWKFHLN